MLIHKATMGVLTYVWNANGTALTKASFAKCPDLKEEEWWEVRADTTVGRIALRYYPNIVPVVQGGKLIDVIPKHETDTTERDFQKEEAKERGYARIYRALPKSGLLDFLSAELHEKISCGNGV